MVQHNRHWSLARQAERAHVATREERADDIPTGDRQIDARGMRRVAVDRDARRTQAPQVVAGDRFERGGRRLVVGALDANGDALAGAEEARGRHDRDAQLVDLSGLEWLARLVREHRVPGIAALAHTTLRGAQPAARELLLLALRAARGHRAGEPG